MASWLSLLAFLVCPVSFAQNFQPLIGPPKAQDAVEAAQLVARKPERTEARLAEIKQQSGDVTPGFFAIAASHGIDFWHCSRQKWFIYDAAARDVDQIFAHKQFYSRARPQEVNREVSPAIDVPWHASYPSGHAAQARLIANVMSTWYPAQAAEFQALALRIADNREIAGLHYKSDTVGGLALGDKLFKLNLQSPEFSRELAQPCSSGSMETPDQAKLYRSKAVQTVSDLQKRVQWWRTQGDQRILKPKN